MPIYERWDILKKNNYDKSLDQTRSRYFDLLVAFYISFYKFERNGNSICVKNPQNHLFRTKIDKIQITAFYKDSYCLKGTTNNYFNN